MPNPYKNQPPKAFWATGVAATHFLDISELWTPKWPITKADRIVTFGSCFAQHFAGALRSNRYGWTSFEPATENMSPHIAKKFSYDVFSARTGNIYTSSLLRQWASWATGEAPPSEVWYDGKRAYDPFRPRIEPNGFATADEMMASRECAIEAFRHCMADCDLFVFTLGLTESWFNSAEGFEYPMCPGTIAGKFDPDLHRFRNQSFAEIRDNLAETITLIRSLNPDVRCLFTVSPVPLTATATQDHVLVATTRSKSVLRAVAAEISDNPMIDYFPSYELITAPPFRGSFFEPNQREVNPHGVAHVMRTFFGAVGSEEEAPRAMEVDTDLVCEEELLTAFGR